MRGMLVAAAVSAALSGCFPRPVGGGYGGPVYVPQAGYPVVPPPLFEMRTPPAPSPSFAPPRLVQCYRLLGGTVSCQ